MKATIALVCLLASFGARAQVIIMGDSTIRPIDDSGNGNLLIAQQATLSQQATILSLSFYVTTASGKLRLGIYDATGPAGGPGALKASTAELTPVVGWNTATVTAQATLAPGTWWLAYFPSSNNLHFRRAGSGSARYYALTYGTMPATFSTSPISIADHWSFYASLNPSATANDFSISAAPASLSIQQGASGTSTISTAVTSGSAGMVSLIASVSPAGPSASLNPTSVVAGSSASLTVSAGISVAPGSYTVTVTGTAGSAMHATTVAVTVTNIVPPPMILSFTASTSVIDPGGAVSLSATYNNGAGVIDHGVGALASGASVTVAPAATTTYTLTVTGSGTATQQVTVTVNARSTTFPLAVAAGGRYLVAANGTPYPVLGDAGWGAPFVLNAADRATYLNDRVAKGFDLIEVMAIGHHPNFPNPPFDASGNLPFLKRLDGATWTGSIIYGNILAEAPDFTTPNETYWAGIDAFLADCLSRNLVVAFFPAYNGYTGGDQGWMQEMEANGTVGVQTYGAWIANRYRNQPNLIWMLGGDLGAGYTASQKAVEEALTAGLKSVATDSTQYAAEWDNGSDGASIQPVSAALYNALTTNGAYSWGALDSWARSAYSDGIGPAFVVEEIYEGNSAAGAGPWRQLEWLGFLDTAGGFIYGNEALWPFSSTWKSALGSPGARSMAVLNSFVASISWQNLVPSGLAGMKVLVTSGAGSTDDDRVTAAATPDGTLLVAYVGPAHSGSFQIDMTVMSETSRARWLDPSSGTFSLAFNALPQTGTQSFTVPGANASGFNDWVLVIDPSPGLPPAPEGLSGSPSVSLIWNSVTGATVYNVYRANAGGTFSLIGGATSNVFTDSGVTAGTTYWYAVSATTSAGEGPRSAPTAVTP